MIDKLNQENHSKVNDKDSKIYQNDSKAGIDLKSTKAKLENQIKDLVAKNEKNIRAQKDTHTFELKELD